MGIRFDAFSSRNVLLSKTKVTPIQKQIPFSETVQTVKPEKPLATPSQKDLQNLRDSILKVAKDFASVNPDASEAEVEAEVDSKFGEGISDIVQLRLEDEGAGTTSIKLTQVNYNELSGENKERLKKASEFANQNFRFEGSMNLSTLSLKGPFLDDGGVKFQSGRYGISYGPDAIAITAAKPKP